MLGDLRDKIAIHLGNVSTTKMIMIVFLLIVFIGITYYVYEYYIQPRLNPDFVQNKELIPDSNVEAVDKNSGNPPEIKFYHVNWCPHSKKAMETWKKVRDDDVWRKKLESNITFTEVNCEGRQEEKDEAEAEDIKAYPTIRLTKSDGTTAEFEATPKEETLKEFIQMMV